MYTEKRKVTIIGAGFVGSTSAFSIISSQTVDEVALIDVNSALAKSQAMDLQHSIPFWGQCHVKAGTYSDIRDSQVVVITAGANQKPGETRLDLIQKNGAIISGIGKKIFAENPKVIVVVVTNPVDVLTYRLVSMFPKKAGQIFGTGTILDTARLRFLLGDELNVHPNNVHAYIMGEHGDSEFPVWSTANIGQVPLHKYPGYSRRKMDEVFEKAKNAAYAIIAGKQATYYAIASGVTMIVGAIFGNKHAVLPVSTLLHNYHGVSNICLSVPSIVCKKGVCETLKLTLNSMEKKQLKNSARVIKQAAKKLK